jgi:hypothetical protein
VRARSTLLLVLVALVVIVGACAAPRQSGGIIVLPGATQRLMWAMRMGYGGVGGAKAPARVRRATSREDLPTGPAAGGRLGDWLLENGTMTAVVANVDRSARGGHLVDLARAPARIDELAGVETLVADGRVRYDSAASGHDDMTGSAWLQVTGRMVAAPNVEVVTRYDVAPDLRGVVMHTSLKLPERPLSGAIAIGDQVSFARTVRVAGSPVDVAGFGATAGYAIEPLAEPPFVVHSATSSASIGLAPELVVVDEPDVPFIYSRVVGLLDRPDEVALASARATVAGQPLGEVALELVAMPRKPGAAVTAGKFLFRRAGSAEGPLELPLVSTMHPGDRRMALLPAGKYSVDFEGEGHRSRRTATVTVAPRVISPIRVEAWAGTRERAGADAGADADADAGAGAEADAGTVPQPPGAAVP